MPARSPDQHGAAGLRGLVVLLVVAAVLVGGFLVGDRWAVGRVQSRVADQLQGQLGTPDPPQVTIAGRPFLTQVVGRSIGSVHVVADGVGTTNRARLVLSHADFVLHDISTRDWWQTMTVRRLDGTALVAYDQLNRVASVPLAYAGPGRVRTDIETGVLGVQVKTRVTGALGLNVADQTVALTDPQLAVNGVAIPDAVATALLATVVKPIPLTGLPVGMRITAAEVAEDGVHATVLGEDLPLER
ncbi:MAG: secreted protein [Friedmanniella sp.]|nr:secreted protein [Friedmanniella sp.]